MGGKSLAGSNEIGFIGGHPEGFFAFLFIDFHGVNENLPLSKGRVNSLDWPTAAFTPLIRKG